MKLFSVILFFISLSAKSANYYIDNAGSDANVGTSQGAAWKTIAKINSSSFIHGDSILFKRNGLWNERLNVPSSGINGSPIIISAYGIGSKPLITALQTQSGFTNVGNIWTTTASNSVVNLNTVLIGGVLCAKGRYPNTSYLTYTIATSTKYKVVGTLTGTPDYTGAECVVRTAHWILDVAHISSQSTGTLNFSDSLTYAPSSNLGCTGYFVQNIASVLDTLNEWCYDSASKVLKVYASGSPSVQISTLDTLCYIHNKTYITLDNLEFHGANKAAIVIDTSTHITVQNCNFNYSGALAISAKKSSKAVIQNDSIQNSLNGAVYLATSADPLANPCDSALVDNNYIYNTGYLAGMGQGLNGMYIGIYVVGTPNTITNNIIINTGYIGIDFNGKSTVKYNYIDTHNYVKDDGGGIYTFIGSYFPQPYDDNSLVRSNIILNGLGANQNVSVTLNASGIYLDANTELVTVDSNTIYNAQYAGIFCGGVINCTITNNTVLDSTGIGFNEYISGEFGYIIKHNIFYSQNTSQPCLQLDPNDLSEVIDSNYYLRPLLETNKLKKVNTLYSLPAWVIATGYDVHSQSTPSGVTNDLPLFYYNNTHLNSIISLDGTYIDAIGIGHVNSISLTPFASTILFRSLTQVTGHTKTRGYKFL